MKPRKFTELTAGEKAVLIETLAETENMSEFLQVLEKRFQLQTCTPNRLTAQMISKGMVNMILPMINPIVK
jgi:hypothetical protein